MAKTGPQSTGLRASYRPGYVDVSPFAIQSSLNKQNGEKGETLLSFPATRAILWDRRPTGEALVLHPTNYRNPALVLGEKTLRLAHRFAQQSTADSYLCYLLGTLDIDPDGQGFSVTVDRFESNEETATGQTLDSIVIPCLVKKNSAKPKTSPDDYGDAIKNVHSRCHSKSKLDLKQLFAIRAYCSYHENQQTFLFHLDFTLVTSGVRCKVTPVSAVPIVPTALSKNLSGPHSMGGLQGQAKAGYLTMDQTRKLLLVLESDPKVDSLPLVGVWISGVSEVTHPHVWAACLRYLFNPSLKERVAVPPEAFLVVLYSPVRSKPEFFECVTSDGSQKLSFDLSASHEVVQLPKDTLSADGSPYEMELLAVESGEKLDSFEAALENNKSLMSPPKAKPVHHSFSEDITPRSGPMPLTRKAPDMQPSVPEVSLLLDEHDPHVAPRPIPRPMQMTHSSSYPEPNHKKSKKKGSSKQRQTGHEGQGHFSAMSGYPDAACGYTARPSGGLMGHGYMPSSCSAQSHGQQAMQNSPMYLNTASQYPGTQPVSHYPGTHPSSQYPGTQPVYPPVPYSQAMQPSAHPIPAQGRPVPPSGNYLPYNPHLPYMYQPPCTSQPMYASHMPQTAPWLAPHMAGTAAHPLERAPTHLASAMPPVPAYSNQLPVYSQGFAGHPALTHDAPQQHGPAGQAMNTTQETQPVVATEMKSPVLRPVRENSDAEDTVIKQAELSASATAHQLSPLRENTVQPRNSQNNSPQERRNQTASSSTDSGLHFSDNQDPDACNNTMESMKSAATNGGQPIHPEVLELLRMQDEQLRLLREQLSQLLSKQGTAEQPSLASEATSQSSEATLQGSHSENKVLHDMATQMSNQATPVKGLSLSDNNGQVQRNPAVNASLFQSSIEQARSANDPMHSDMGFMSLTHQDISIQSGNLNELAVPLEQALPQGSQQAVATNSQASSVPTEAPSQSTPQRPPLQDGGGAAVNVSADTMSFGDLHSLMQLPDRTQESLVSDMLVDMPAYTSLSPDKRSGSGFTDTDDSNRSPLLGESVSMYERQLAEVEASGEQEEAGPGNTLLFKDQRQFYQNLMGNVQKLLGNTGSTEDSLLPSTPPHHNPMTDFQSPYNALNHADDERAQHTRDTAAAFNRSLSVPDDMAEMTHSKRTEPLRQSYPQTDDVRRGCSMDDDVAEKTRQQLQAMGIQLEKLSPTEKSRMLEQSSFFLDPAMLPRVQYVSMVLDGNENDLSAEADALAMKYLSDEQLTQLSKMRLSSPAGKGGRRMAGREFDRMLSSPGGALGGSGARSNNSTLYGPNHISFASRKYLERYGLLENTSGGNISHETPDDSQRRNESWPKSDGSGDGEWDASQGVRVKEFLTSLRERSLTENTLQQTPVSNNPAAHNASDSRQNSFHSVTNESANLVNNYSIPDQTGTHQSPSVPSTPAYQPLKKSNEFERTPQIPAHSYPQQMDRPIFNTSAPHIQTEKVINVFDNVPMSVPRQRNARPCGPMYGNDQPRFYGAESKTGGSNQVENVLDIPRLKEMPKLL